MTLTCCQDHILTENIWFVWSETSYSGDERRCYRCGTNDDKQTVKIELLSQWKLEAEFRNFDSRAKCIPRTIPRIYLISVCVFDLFHCILCTAACVTSSPRVMCVTPPPTEASRCDKTHSWVLHHCAEKYTEKYTEKYSWNCRTRSVL